MTDPRVAGPSDVDAAVDTLTTAFAQDPLWGPVFAPSRASVLWRFCVRSALRYPWVLVTPAVEAVALWIPPGGVELTSAEQALLPDALGKAAGAVAVISDELDAARPREPHFYLSLLGTHDRHRGRGIGMGLLAASLSRIDALGGAAYLESSNPANIDRYRRVGFVPRSELRMSSGPVVTTMWRPPASA